MLKKLIFPLVLLTFSLSLNAQKVATNKDKNPNNAKKESPSKDKLMASVKDKTGDSVKDKNTTTKDKNNEINKDKNAATSKTNDTKKEKSEAYTTQDISFTGNAEEVIVKGDGYSIVRTKYKMADTKPAVEAKKDSVVNSVKLKDSAAAKPKESVLVKPKDTVIINQKPVAIEKAIVPVLVQKKVVEEVQQKDSVWLKSGDLLTGKIIVDKDNNTFFLAKDTANKVELKPDSIFCFIVFPKKYEEERVDVMSISNEFYFLETSPKATIKIFANRTFKAVLNDGPKHFIVQNKYCLMKNNVPYLLDKGGRTKETLMFLMNDCKRVMDDFKSGKFTKDNFIEAVTQYNRCSK